MYNMKRIITLLLACVAAMLSCGSGSAGQAGSEVIKLNTEEFNRKVSEKGIADFKYLGDKPAIVDFYADWCGPCKRVAPVLEEIAKEYAGEIHVYKVNVDDDPELAERFHIRSIPAIFFISADGEHTHKLGALSKEMIKETIATQFNLEQK